MTAEPNLSAQVHSDEPLDARTKAYFQQRMMNRLFSAVVWSLVGRNPYRLTHRTGRRDAELMKFLSSPAEWDFDSISDFLLAAGMELKFEVVEVPHDR